MSRQNKQLQKLKDREYREEFLNATVRGGIAYQAQALRRQDGSSQEQFAVKTGKKQSQIAKLESTEYGGVTVQTLIDIAAALGIGLVVKWVDLAEMLERTEDMSDAALRATPIDKLPLAVPVASRVDRQRQANLEGADTWQTTNLQSLISYLKESMQTNSPREEPPGSGTFTLTTPIFDPTSSILH